MVKHARAYSGSCANAVRVLTYAVRARTLLASLDQMSPQRYLVSHGNRPFGLLSLSLRTKHLSMHWQILASLPIMTEAYAENWSRILPYIQLVYSTTPRAGSPPSAYDVVLARQPRMPRSALLPPRPTDRRGQRARGPV